MLANVGAHEILATAFGQWRTHDFQLFKDSCTGISTHIRLLADAGYQGLTEWHINSQTPSKRTKLHSLSREQKDKNRGLSQQRILVENIIRRLKIFCILSERHRNRRKRFGLRVDLIYAIYNLELKLTC